MTSIRSIFAYYIEFNMEANWSDQLKLGEMTLKNRVFMAALTR